ncbi:hypothetical protein F511_34994 [Dorcoceras hygrometricum]|uniref:Uncharacterized protein n=1 Tax=Dorcoceras hygrometricum TaxID=472368 RepID=A0A2Z7CIQ4_9LAMI|nr:hypothetical protein F511_34994 [Dorcoceras hygrometricum]
MSGLSFSTCLITWFLVTSVVVGARPVKHITLARRSLEVLFRENGNAHRYEEWPERPLKSFCKVSDIVSLLFFHRTSIVLSNNPGVVMAASDRGLEHMPKGIDSRKMLQEMKLNFGKSKLMSRRRREMAGVRREAPEGPDPQHH